ncbi:MAG: hypothetical protein ACFFD2_04965 [Promethearchaeota archaeon]
MNIERQRRFKKRSKNVKETKTKKTKKNKKFKKPIKELSKEEIEARKKAQRISMFDKKKNLYKR